MSENRSKNIQKQSDAYQQREAEKKDRLAKALRDNLKKRRHQAGGRKGSNDSGQNDGSI